MTDLLPTALFYLFAGTLLASAVGVISSRNSVHSVFFLILSFFNASALFLLLGAEYLAMTLIIVYVGAVAVLFLFVVMMLDVNFAELRQGFLRYLPIGATVATVLLIEIIGLLHYAFTSREASSPAPLPADAEPLTNTQAIGVVLYTDYIYAFQISGLILLVAMIGAIVLTLRHRPGVRRQRIGRQVSRKRADAVEVVKVRPGQGA